MSVQGLTAPTAPAKALSTWAWVYVGSVTVLGLCAIGQSVYALYSVPIGWNWFVLAVLTLISGSATVKLPSVPATISVSETFVFTSVLLFGTAAGTLTVALDALVISLWLARKGHPFYRIAFNVCALPASLWVGAHVFYWMWARVPLSIALGPVPIRGLIVPLVLFTLSYFLLNSWLIAIAISFEKRLPPFGIWRDNFAWLSLNYFGGASVAALLVTYTKNIDYAYLAFVLPLLAVLYFTFSMSMGRVEDANRHLRELNRLYMSTIETLAMAIDAKDQITHGHIRRVQTYAIALAKSIGVTDVAQLSAIEAASLLHDMGKLAVPEHILNKPGPLTPAEFEKMKLHASVGADILSAIEFPYPVVPVVRHHHENWDGTGYPDGLSGSNIPLGARILSVVDCFDALTSDRPYRPRLSDAEAIEILLERRSTMYDPLIVDAFVREHVGATPPGLEHRTSPEIDSLVDAVSPAATSSLEDIAASTEETLALYNLARALSTSMELSRLVDVLAQHLRRVIPSSTCVLYLFDSGSDALVVAHANGEAAPHFFGMTIPRGQRLSGWVAANHHTILNSDPVLDLGEAGRRVRPRLRSCLSTPLLLQGELVGVLTLYSVGEKVFSENHARIVESVADQVAPVVKGCADSAKSDDLNRALPMASTKGAQELEESLHSALAAGRHSFVSLVFLHRENLLSDPSHRDGSWELIHRIFAELTAPHLSFWCGDELVLFLPGTTSQEAFDRAAQLGRSISTLTMAAAESSDSAVQVVLRRATAPTDGVTVAALIKASLKQQVIGPLPAGLETKSVH